MRLIRYLTRRLEERSTWAAIGIGIAGASVLVAPWSYAAVAVAVIGALVPTSGGGE